MEHATRQVNSRLIFRATALLRIMGKGVNTSIQPASLRRRKGTSVEMEVSAVILAHLLIMNVFVLVIGAESTAKLP